MIKFSKSDWIDIYNNIPKILWRKAIKVTLTEESIRQKSQEQILLKQTQKGSYGIIATEDETYWLFPKTNLSVNRYSYEETVKYLFDCQGYQAADTNIFVLKDPAKVSLTSSRQAWYLEEKGVLDFGHISESSQLESRLNQVIEEREKLLFKIEQLTQERSHLTTQLAELAYENLIEIRSQFVLREEFQQLANELETQFENKLNSQILRLESELKIVREERAQLFDKIEQLTQSRFQKQAQQAPEEDEQFINLFPNSTSLILSEEENDLVYWYHHDPNQLLPYKTEVAATEESLEEQKLNSAKATVFLASRRGSYWVITLKNRNHLVPQVNFKINKHNYTQIKAFFDCEGYQEGQSIDFKLIKSAKVNPQEDQWKLIERGVLRF